MKPGHAAYTFVYAIDPQRVRVGQDGEQAMVSIYIRKSLPIILVALSTVACGFLEKSMSPTAGSTSASGQAALNSEAEVALARAEGDIARAKANHALWTSADAAIMRAREAALIGDNATVITQARIASDLAILGLAQRNYPTTEK